jgi:hypothetical protein
VRPSPSRTLDRPKEEEPKRYGLLLATLLDSSDETQKSGQRVRSR